MKNLPLSFVPHFPLLLFPEAVVQTCSLRKGVLRNFTKFTGKHLYQSLIFNKVAGLRLKKETLAQVFSCKFCETSKNTFSYRTPLKKIFLKNSQHSQENTRVEATLLKRESHTIVFQWILQNLKNNCFEKHLRMAASVDTFTMFWFYV